jgi:hypothetical protein
MKPEKYPSCQHIKKERNSLPGAFAPISFLYFCFLPLFSPSGAGLTYLAKRNPRQGKRNFEQGLKVLCKSEVQGVNIK